ncbi:GP158 protein, partial [Centropus bengalensis]|nr:GP158 protein [Centropus bengalensis]
CQPCQPGCSTCQDDAPCLIQEDRALRAAVLSCQACCMLAVFLSMLVSYHFRRSKARHPRLLGPPPPAGSGGSQLPALSPCPPGTGQGSWLHPLPLSPQRIRASGVILLETILFGSLLLYFPVFILYFKPSIFRCIVLRWVRALGFAAVYGTITLKLYRWRRGGLGARGPPRGPRGLTPPRPAGLPPPLSERPQDLSWLRADRPARALSPGGPGSVMITGVGVSPAAEMLFLLWGSFLCCAMRAVPSAFHEPRYMGIALHNELMVSAAFHVVRRGGGPWCFREPSPSSPQFLHAGSPLREEIAAEVYEDELDMRRSGSCLNSSIASAWSEHSLDPDDIREELKKLYTQLEVHKTWGMETNNPHLPKKRSSRRSLGRSAVQR